MERLNRISVEVTSVAILYSMLERAGITNELLVRQYVNLVIAFFLGAVFVKYDWDKDEKLGSQWPRKKPIRLKSVLLGVAQVILLAMLIIWVCQDAQTLVWSSITIIAIEVMIEEHRDIRRDPWNTTMWYSNFGDKGRDD